MSEILYVVWGTSTGHTNGIQHQYDDQETNRPTAIPAMSYKDKNKE